MSLHQRTVGEGTRLLLVHGSAATGDGWAPQLRGLRDRFRMTAIDRRGAPRSPVEPGTTRYDVPAHAEDLAGLLEAEGPAIVCGSSFGGVCCLHLARTRPELVLGLVLCEPPLASDDGAMRDIRGFVEDFERVVAEAGGDAAGRHFLRTVLGEADFDAMPEVWQVRAASLWPQIRLDVHALAAYPPDYTAYRKELRMPALMLGGDRTQGYLPHTLERLRQAIRGSSRLTLRDAGHMMHLDQPEAFNRTLSAFAKSFVE